MKQLKKVELNNNSFYANGRKYIIHNSLSICRYELFEKMQMEVTFGVDFESLFKIIKDAMTLVFNKRGEEAYVLLHNTLSAIKRPIENREHPILLLCSLFICREGENLSEWNKANAIEKINDWKKEGFDMAGFFQLAFILVQGFSEVYNQNSLNTLNPKKTKIKAEKTKK